MPSQKWFEDNPKVSAYISRELYEALETWMQKHRVKKVAQALTTILETHLGFIDAPASEEVEEPIVAPDEPAIASQIEELLERMEKLERLVKEQGEKEESPVNDKPSSPGQLELLVVKSSSTQEEDAESEWLTTRDAHRLYGNSSTYEYFRKCTPEQMLEKFGLICDLSRKEKGKASSQWIKRSMNQAHHQKVVQAE